MRQVGRVFSLLHEQEEEDLPDLEVQKFRITRLLDALKEKGYRINNFLGNEFKFSIGEQREDGFEEVGILDDYELYTRDSKKLEKFLEDYRF